MSLSQIFSDASALFMLWLFVRAGLHKLAPANRDYFAALLGEYGWHSRHIALPLTLVGLTELGIGLAIFLPASRSVAALAACAMLLGYLLLMATQLYRGHRDMDCGCGGPGGGLKISGALLLRNLLLAGSALLCLLPGYSQMGGYWLFAVSCAVIAILINLCAEQLIANAQQLKTLRG